MIWSFLLTCLGWLLVAIVILIIWLILDVMLLAVYYTVRYIRRPHDRTTPIFHGKASQ